MDLLDLVLDYDCNLACTYCTITPEMRRRNLDTRTLAGHIVDAAREGTRSLSITGGEPTLRKDLLTLVRLAHKQGFTDIKVQTNGLALAHGGTVRAFEEAGVTRVHVSVHGHHGEDGSDYIAITRGEGRSHRLLKQALAELAASSMDLHVDLILMEETYRDLPAAVRDLRARGATRFHLWLVSLTDNNRDRKDSLPRITEMLPQVREAMDWAVSEGLQIDSLHIPRCLLPGHEDRVAHPGFGESVSVVTPEAVFQLSRSRLGGQFKPERCRDCRFDALCPGLREDYVEHHGDEELVPVT